MEYAGAAGRHIFDFSYIDRVLEGAEKFGLSVIVGTPTYAVPAWLVQKDPGVMVVNAGGREKYGHRQIFDLLNPTFRFHAERVIRQLVSHTAPYRQVTGFQIDNETKHYDNRGREIQRQFVEYLKEKFQTPEKLKPDVLSAVLEQLHPRLGSVPGLSGCINGGLAGEFEKFQRKTRGGLSGVAGGSLSGNISVKISLSPTILTSSGKIRRGYRAGRLFLRRAAGYLPL